MIESSLHEGEELQEYEEDVDRSLVIHRDMKESYMMKKLLGGYDGEDLRYANSSPHEVILPSYKKASRG